VPEEHDKLTSTGTDVTVAVVIFLVLLAIFGAYLQAVGDIYRTFIDWWYAKDWGTFFTVVAIIFSILDAILIWFVIFTIRRHARLDELFPEEESLVVHVVPLDKEVRSVWVEIQHLVNSINPSDWNMAIIRADGLFDDVLKRLGNEGESMADRLKIIDPNKLPSFERIWSAHRLRNTIVHGPLQEHARETISHAIRSYELGLIELGALKMVVTPSEEK